MDFVRYSTRGSFGIQKFTNWFKPSEQLLYAADRQHPKSLLLTELPNELLTLILDELPTNDRLKIRNVCHRLRRVADNHAIHYKNIKLMLWTDHAFVYLDNQLTHLCFADSRWLFGDKTAHIKFAFQKLKSILRVSKLQLDTLTILTSHEPHEKDGWEKRLDKIIKPAIDDLKKFMSCLPHQVSVKQLFIDHGTIDVLHQLVPHFNPGTLKSIDFPETRDLAIKQNVKTFLDMSDMFRLQ